MDSDEEEMAAMRSSSRYGGGRQPAPGASSKPAATNGNTKAQSGQGPSKADSDDDDAGAALARRRQQQQRVPLGPSRGSASSMPASADSDDMAVDEEPADDEMQGMRGFLPVTFGRKSGQKLTGGADAKTLEAAQRNDPKAVSPQKKTGVQFGPRVMEAAAVAGAASRRAAASAKAAQEAEARARAEAMEEEALEKKKQGGDGRDAEEDESLYGFVEAPPEAGKEHEVLPVTHEAVIPVHERTITAIGLDPKGSRMVAGGLDGQCKYYDFNGMSEAKESFRSLEPVEGHMVQAISFSPTGGVCLVVCSDSHARIFDRDGSSKPVQATVKGDMYVRDMSQTNGHTQMLTDGMWHPLQPNNWVTSSLDGTVRIWDLNAKPVGMDQVLPSMHVLKTLDKRNVCLGGASGRSGGLYPTCCAYSPTGALIAGGCSDGSVQVFFEKARYQKPDKILRTAHGAQVTAITFLGDGVGGNKMVTRSMDNSMKLWDCRVLSDAKGPVKTWESLPAGHEKQGVCASPDGTHIVTGTSMEKGTKGNSTLRVFSTDDFSQVKNLDFGQKSAIRCTWHPGINQIVVGTFTGEVVMLYSPFSSKKGALHFVGRHRRAKAAHEIEDSGFGPIFPMVEGKDIAEFWRTAHGNLDSLRRQDARLKQKTIVPEKPAELDNRTATTSGTKLVSHVILNLEGKSKVASEDSQKALLKYANKDEKMEGKNSANQIYMSAYAKTQPVNILDYSVDENEGDQKMQLAMKGDFCRKCGMKLCRCVDYSQWRSSNTHEWKDGVKKRKYGM